MILVLSDVCNLAASVFIIVSFVFGCDIALVDFVLGFSQSLMASAFLVQNWISSCLQCVLGAKTLEQLTKHRLRPAVKS